MPPRGAEIVSGLGGDGINYDQPEIGRGFILQMGQVILQAWNDPKLRAQMELTGATPVPVLSPGWAAVERRKRKSRVEWEGRDGVRLQFSVMIDGVAEAGRGGATRVERTCRVLEQLAGHRTGNTPPPKIFVASGGLIPHDHTHAPHLKWVIESLEWGGAFRNRRGRRLRQFADVGLLEYVEDQVVGLPAVQKTKKETSRAWVDVRKGDTLRKIAARHKVTKSEMPDFKRINKVRDLDKVLTVSRVKLPPRGGVFGG